MAFFGRLAELVVEIGARTLAFEKALGGVRGALYATSGAMNRVGGLADTLFVGAVGGGIAALGVGLFRGVAAAENLGESLSKAGVVFGPAAAGVVDQANQMAKAFGVSKQEIIDAASSIGLIGKAAGLTQDAAASLGKQFASLGADVSSFYNVSLEEALTSIRSGIVGESEPLRRFGVLLSEDAVKAEAARMGIKDLGKGLTEGQKVQARAAIITRSLADATGDLSRTIDSAKNASRKSVGSLSNLFETIGEVVLPIKGQLVSGFNDAIGTLGSLFEENKATVGSWVDSIIGRIDTARVFVGRLPEVFAFVRDSINVSFGTDSLGLVGRWADTISSSFGMLARNLPEFLRIVQLRFIEWGSNIGAVVGTIPANLGLIADYISGNWYHLIVDAVTAVGAVFTNFGTNLANLGQSLVEFLSDPFGGFRFDWTPLLTGFQATAAQLPELIRPELTSMQSEIDAAFAKIGENEARRAERLAEIKTGAAPGAPKPPATVPTAPGTGKGLDLFASAQEFVKRTQANVSKAEDPTREVAKNTATANDLLRSLNEKVSNMGKTQPAIAVGPA